MVHTMITSKLDYCNAILYIWSARVNAKALHQGSEYPACFISQHGKYEHIIPVLKQYHWLPIRQRIHYKVLMLTFMSLNGLAPTYLEELMKRRPMKEQGLMATMTWWSPPSSISPLEEDKWAIWTKLWNTLPKELKTCTNINTFKKLLETFLFKKAYLQ